MTSPSTPDEMNDRYLDGDYLGHNPSWHVEDSPWKASKILLAMARNDLKPATICEVGSGAGEILNRLHAALDSTVQLTGFDISPQAHALAVQREKPRLAFRLADFLEEETPPYDLLLVMDVVEHVEDYLGFLHRLRGRGATVIFQIPIDLSAYAALRPKTLANGRRLFGHLHYFNRSTALASLEHVGFDIVDAFYASAAGDGHALGKGSLPARLLAQVRRALWRLNPELSARLLGGVGLIVVAR